MVAAGSKLYLDELGYKINRKRVQRLMRKLGLAGMAPGPNTSEPHPQHKIYPYLLRGHPCDPPQASLVHGYYILPAPTGLHVPGGNH